MIAIGIDTGGTCTDAVVYDCDTHTVLAAGKAETTHGHLEDGIRAALQTLPRERVDEAAYLSLSTTLATNACVEKKGGRVCLLFFGVKQETVEETYGQYGFSGTDFMYFFHGNPGKNEEPEWERLEELIPTLAASYDSIAFAQIQPKDNDGAFEKEAKRRIEAVCDLPVVCAYEIFKDLNVIKRGAGAYLNARLLPVIQEFFAAVRKVLREEQMEVPFVIMRSDGSLVSEEYSSQYPVETLLCGPTASVKGGMELCQTPEAIVVDMGGTTSDIALIGGGEPLMDEEGVRVGDWQTFVRGIAIDTFALGGDTQIGYENRTLQLGERRVMPISVLAKHYPQVSTELHRLAALTTSSARPLYEHLILMKDIQKKQEQYTQRERDICRCLQEGPLSIGQLAGAIGTDVYMLQTTRLEEEGVLLRSGFTPTDAMILREDYPGWDKHAARDALIFLCRCVDLSREDALEEMYRLVKERLYCNLVRILWEKTHRGRHQKLPEGLDGLAKESFAVFYGQQLAKKETLDGTQACESGSDKRSSGTSAGQQWEPGEVHGFFDMQITTPAVLIAAGAPTHIFLPDVAKALHTTCRTSEFSGVANAIGALLGDVCVYETISIGIEREISSWDEEEQQYVVYGASKEKFLEYKEAFARAKELAAERAKEKAIQCGATQITEVTWKEHTLQGQTNLGTIFMGTDVTAKVHGRLMSRTEAKATVGTPARFCE